MRTKSYQMGMKKMAAMEGMKKKKKNKMKSVAAKLRTKLYNQ